MYWTKNGAAPTLSVLLRLYENKGVGSVRKNGKCNCLICKVERHLAAALAEPPGVNQFTMFAASREPLSSFESVSGLVRHLRAQRDGEGRPPFANEIFAALILASKSQFEAELSQSVLTLAFIPAIHRTYSEIKAWFRELSADEISQQTFVCFLELTASVPAGMVNGQLSFLIARSLRRNVFRWAQREMFLLRKQSKALEDLRPSLEPSFHDNFENVALLNDLLDHAYRNGFISEFERCLLLKMKVEGLQAKEVAGMNTVLSAKAVQNRIERIMLRLQKAVAPIVLGESIRIRQDLRPRTKEEESTDKGEGSFFGE